MTTTTKSKIWKPPVFKHFRSTDLLNAFILNAIVTAVIASMTLVIDDGLAQLVAKQNWKLRQPLRRFIAFVLAIVAGFACYLVIWFFFGFGGGMLVNGVEAKLI